MDDVECGTSLEQVGYNDGFDGEGSEQVVPNEEVIDPGTPVPTDDLMVIKQFYQAVCDKDMVVIAELVQKYNVDVNLIFTENFIKPWHHGLGAIHILQTTEGALRVLVNLGAHPDLKTSSGNTALHIACKRGNTASAEFLLMCDNSLKDCLDGKGLTPLMKAVYRYEQNYKNRYTKMVKLLIDAGCDVNISASSGITPLHLAAEKWDPMILKLLISASANVNSLDTNGKSPLLAALLCERVNTEIIRLLIDAGADINVRIANNTGRMPLHLAVIKGYEVCVENLLRAGADPNCQDYLGRTPLWLAVLDNNMKITPMLLDHGADINYTSSPQKLSVLSLAIKNSSPQLIELLIANGASIDTETVFGASPLYLAVERNVIEIVKIVLQENCDLNTLSNARHALKPQTPFTVALEIGNPEIIKLLMEVGCEVREWWIEQSNLPLSVQSNLDLCEWMWNFIREPKSLSLLCVLSLRTILGLKCREKLQTLSAQNHIPRSLIPKLLLLDILT